MSGEGDMGTTQYLQQGLATPFNWLPMYRPSSSGSLGKTPVMIYS